MRGFQAPPDWWTRFASNGATEAEIRVAMLDCGSSVPGYFTDYRMPDGQYFPEAGSNEAISVTSCMIDSGFPYKGTVAAFCAAATNSGRPQLGIKDVPACKPGAVIPKRSVENRLNSLYCKTYPKAAICQPNYDPRAPQPKAAVDTRPVSINIAPSTSQAVKLQEQVQKDSNAQMDQLRQATGAKK